ncbi:MAG: pyridoxamine 5'-phosphate oxidase family protein [Acetatifactor sp.]|nr:pyridoxamine 5'-phosphate oxidase family protein [Acetatifactor sp.]
MRRAEREVTELDQMLEIMERCDCCRLGLGDGDSVYIVPLNFGWREAEGKVTLFFHGAEDGKKMELLNALPRAGFEMDTAHELVKHTSACGYTFRYQSIIGRGRVTLVEDSAEKLSGLQCILAHYGGGEKQDFAEEMVKRTAVIKLEVEEWSCKSHV